MGKLELVIESDNVSIYSPKYDGETQTEFEKFMSDNGDCGARENLFRPEGNNIKAIPLCIEQRRGKGVGTRKIHADYDDYQKVKMIIEAITI